MLKENEELVLVACSGGLDSSTTLSLIHISEYKNIIACHYNYGHRGSDAEQLAITNVCQELNIPLKIFDLNGLYNEMDVKSISMLANNNAKITTGTISGLKKLDAWHPGRNMLMATIMATFAETEVMKYDYNKVHLVAGWQNLSESGHYPDNSESFCNSYLELFKYGTLIGNRIKPLFVLSNLMKHELFVLIKEFKLENIYRHTISCDRPKIQSVKDVKGLQKKTGSVMSTPEGQKIVPCNCMKNGMPACGSGLLSFWGSKMIGLNDMKMRNFYEVDDPYYEPHIPQHLKDGFNKNPNIHEIIDRILLPEDKIENLRKIHKQLQGE